MNDTLSALKKTVSGPRTSSPEELEWGRVAPVGREFGSPDFDRLMALDAVAAEALGDRQKIRPWLNEPNDQLDRKTPE